MVTIVTVTVYPPAVLSTPCVSYCSKYSTAQGPKPLWGIKDIDPPPGKGRGGEGGTCNGV